MLTNDLQQTTSIDNERLLEGSDSDFDTIVPFLSTMTTTWLSASVS
jgi:hypothetical protein